MLSQATPSHIPNDSSESGPGTTPFQLALILAGVYCLFCAVYIVLSTGFAARISQSVPEMLNIETAKGLAFVLLTGALFLLQSSKLFSLLTILPVHLGQKYPLQPYGDILPQSTSAIVDLFLYFA